MNLGCKAGAEPLCGRCKERAQAQAPSSASAKPVQGGEVYVQVLRCNRAVYVQVLRCNPGLLSQAKPGVLQVSVRLV